MSVRDQVTDRDFLIDSGADHCVHQAGAADRAHVDSESLVAANGSIIRSLGRRIILLKFGDCTFTYEFILNDLILPILGADFFIDNQLVIDLANKKLVNPYSSSAIYARQDMSSNIRLNRICATAFKALFDAFPGLCTPKFHAQDVKHQTRHHIVTTGPPLHASARRLHEEKLEIARKSFAEMEELGICRRSDFPLSSPPYTGLPGIQYSCLSSRYCQCLHFRLYHVTPADYEDFVAILLRAKRAFNWIGDGGNAYNSLLQTIRRSKSCKRELWQKVSSAQNQQNGLENHPQSGIVRCYDVGGPGQDRGAPGLDPDHVCQDWTGKADKARTLMPSGKAGGKTAASPTSFSLSPKPAAPLKKKNDFIKRQLERLAVLEDEKRQQQAGREATLTQTGRFVQPQWHGQHGLNCMDSESMCSPCMVMETWRAFHSQDGPGGSRNALGQVLFPANVATRSTRSEAAGIVSLHLPYAANTLVDNGIALWNKFPALREASTKRMASN
eukprot:maker-scaffold550_size154339-snap-gene-0.22 protein:Tk11253 transcript:maker-scaffold550_size154339-snap-gene-0.22-mRNA-1 annotation:"unnamed protein product"